MGLQEQMSLYDRGGGDLMKRAKFTLGQIVATPGALEVMKTEGIDGVALLSRHITGDWET